MPHAGVLRNLGPLRQGPALANMGGKTGEQPMTTLKLRIYFDEAMLGPGKAELLEGIRDTGSIAAAGRRMGMSYKRAWALVEEMNAAFRAPLVSSARGGAGGGGAQLTPEGREVLEAYRAMLAAAEQAAAPGIARIAALLRDMSDGK